MIIRETTDADLKDMLFIEREAFKSEKEAQLTKELLNDSSAKPLLSLIAYVDEKPAGHILFTKGYLNAKSKKLLIYILAPLAVVPEFQRKGVGGALIQKGLDLLYKTTIGLVFVLGHPQYYPRYGFRPAGKLGFEAPFPIPEKDADAWMVQELRSGFIGSISGRVVCSDALNKPEHWRE